MTGAGSAANGAAPEFSRQIAVDEISEIDTQLDIEADEKERAALARRFDLLAVDALSARIGLKRCMARDGSGPVVRATLAIDAEVTQSCVVTLEPVTARIAETDLIIEFRPADAAEFTSEVDIPPEAYDPPEILVGDKIDIGELAAEHLALALDPYPRADGAKDLAQSAVSDGPADSDEDHPFAALKRWKDGPSTDKA